MLPITVQRFSRPALGLALAPGAPANPAATTGGPRPRDLTLPTVPTVERRRWRRVDHSPSVPRSASFPRLQHRISAVGAGPQIVGREFSDCPEAPALPVPQGWQAQHRGVALEPA
jgi:hypothetical protein